MATFTVKAEIRWADIDPNFHVLHSKYYDYCANARMGILSQYGITMQVVQEQHIGPILFREECVFKRELKFGDDIEVRIKLLKATADFSRWSFVNEIWKNGDTLAAIVTVDGAWMDTEKRKLAIPPESFQKAFDAMPKAENFTATGG
jgi:acyl-CoA thioester hydrolase